MTQEDFNDALHLSFKADIAGFSSRQDYIVAVAKILAKLYGLSVL